MNYIVNYGVNNSHMCEGEAFVLYRDAVKFFNCLESKWEAKAIMKLKFKNGFVCDRECKKFKFQSGTDNTEMLKAVCNI